MKKYHKLINEFLATFQTEKAKDFIIKEMTRLYFFRVLEHEFEIVKKTFSFSLMEMKGRFIDLIECIKLSFKK